MNEPTPNEPTFPGDRGESPPGGGGAVVARVHAMERETDGVRGLVAELDTLAVSYRRERRGALRAISRSLRMLWTRLGIRPTRSWPWRVLPRVPHRRRGEALAALQKRHHETTRRIKARFRVLAKASWPARRLQLAILYLHFRARWARPLLVLLLFVLLLWLLEDYLPADGGLGLFQPREGSPP